MYQVAEYCPPFYLRVNGLGFFPNKRKPRVVWMGLNGDIEKRNSWPNASMLMFRIWGLNPKNSPLSHHPGRIRSERNVEELLNKARLLEATTRSNPFPVQAFYLMESRLSREGPHYRIEQAFALRG